eukprot:10454855-Ditylum_brightwellii.AAC.1
MILTSPRRPPQSSLIDANIGENAMMLPRRPVPDFLFQLTLMLSESSNHQFIEWSHRLVVVHDPVNLEKKVLKKYFRHSKYSSFQRQMNYFGFRKNAGKGRMSPCTYENDSVTNNVSSLLSIKRKKQGNPSISTIAKKNVKTLDAQQFARDSNEMRPDDKNHAMKSIKSRSILPRNPKHITPITKWTIPKVEIVDKFPQQIKAENGALPVLASSFINSAKAIESLPAQPTSASSLPICPSATVPHTNNEAPVTQSVQKCEKLRTSLLTTSISPEPMAEELFAHHRCNVPNPLLSSSPHFPATAAVQDTESIAT